MLSATSVSWCYLPLQCHLKQWSCWWEHQMPMQINTKFFAFNQMIFILINMSGIVCSQYRQGGDAAWYNMTGILCSQHWQGRGAAWYNMTGILCSQHRQGRDAAWYNMTGILCSQHRQGRDAAWYDVHGGARRSAREGGRRHTRWRLDGHDGRPRTCGAVRAHRTHYWARPWNTHPVQWVTEHGHEILTQYNA